MNKNITKLMIEYRLMLRIYLTIKRSLSKNDQLIKQYYLMIILCNQTKGNSNTYISESDQLFAFLFASEPVGSESLRPVEVLLRLDHVVAVVLLVALERLCVILAADHVLYRLFLQLSQDLLGDGVPGFAGTTL